MSMSEDITVTTVGVIGLRSYNNSQCHISMASPLETKNNIRIYANNVEYNGTCFPVDQVPYGRSYQTTLTARNINTGALYVLWYDGTVQGFRIGKVIEGTNPTVGQQVAISYPYTVGGG